MIHPWTEPAVLWPALILIALACSAMHFYWRRQQSEWREQLDTLRSENAELGAALSTRIEEFNQADKQISRFEVEMDASQAARTDLVERLQSVKDELRLSGDKWEQLNQELRRSEAEKKETSGRLEQSKIQLQQLQEEFHRVRSRLEQTQSDHQQLLEQHSRLKTSLEERETQHQKQLALFDEQKKALQQEFENLANRIFEEKGKHFAQSSQTSIEHLLKPFREQITEFRARIDNIQKENNEATGSLRKELEQLRALNQEITIDARNLTQALKGDKKKVGSWGEVQLEKTLQLAGLVKGDHYETQAHFKDEQGKKSFPDFVVKLPDEKHIVIDSKVSLVDYDAAIAAEDDEALSVALERHAMAVKNHIDNLASKDYSNLIGMRSPSFVLMFMPIEPAYIEAMRQNKELFNYGYQKGVILVSHTTLMPILRTVANLWMIERSNAEAREISDKAGDVYNQVCLIGERMQKLGATIQTANRQYNSTVVALVGQQGLHGKVERFSKLSNKVSRKMPEMDTIHADVDWERLEVVAAENNDTDAEIEQEPAVAESLAHSPEADAEKDPK